MKIQLTPWLGATACRDLISHTQDFMEKHPEKLWRDDNQSDSRIFNVERKVIQFQPLFEKMVVAYSEAFGAPDYAFLMYNYLQAKSGNKGSGGGWHRDSYRFQAKAFCYLSDVTSKTGPLQFIPGTDGAFSKAVDYVKKRRSTRYEEAEIHAAPIEVTGAAGSGFVLNTSGIHRGKPIEGLSRHACTLYAFKGSNRVISHLKQRFETM